MLAAAAGLEAESELDTGSAAVETAGAGAGAGAEELAFEMAVGAGGGITGALDSACSMGACSTSLRSAVAGSAVGITRLAEVGGPDKVSASSAANKTSNSRLETASAAAWNVASE